MDYVTYAAHTFTDTPTAPFNVREYSRLKFGDKAIAKKFGYYLAESFAAHYRPTIIANKLLVIPSPYNYVKNAATIMTEHFIDRLNQISVENNGEQVEASIIHRKVTYTRDYGHLSKEDRKGLLDGDSFYINEEFVKDKVLLFIDDVIITGTHEDKIKDLLDRKNIENDAYFLYFAQYLGNNPEIEAVLNFANFQKFSNYVDFVTANDPHMIIRPLKYILSQTEESVRRAMEVFKPSTIESIYNGCLAEGYYKLPQYQSNFAIIKQRYHNAAFPERSES